MPAPRSWRRSSRSIPETSFIDCKQLLLFSIVPIAYRLLPGRRALTVLDVIITVGAISAVIGVVQFGILEFDSLGQRPRGLLGMYMTYSGQLMLIACIAAARVLFRKDDRLWTALVMPALIAALAATLSRNAWVGACVGIGLLFIIRDFRLFALLPVALAAFIAFAPSQMTDRLYSSFRIKHLRHDTAATEASLLSNRDRLAMMRSGFRIIKDDPLTGVGPDMVIKVYAYYRDPNAVQQLNSHLHNVPLQIAAERGLPALAIWLWFIFTLLRDFVEERMKADPSLANGALAVTVAMVAAGMFEYNFGDSEFLMLFLVLVTLPYAAESQHTGVAACMTGSFRSSLAPSGPHPPRRRRPDARSFSGRRGRSHFARSSGAGRAIRSRELPARWGGQRRPQRRRARRARSRRRDRGRR